MYNISCQIHSIILINVSQGIVPESAPEIVLTLGLLGNFSLVFFKINFFKNFFKEYHQIVKKFGSRSGLSSNCLQSYQQTTLVGKS